MALVTSQQIKTRTSLGGNVDPDKFMHLVDDAEALVLEPVLGTKLYDKIVSDVGDASISGNYLTIYNDYIVPILCYSVFAEYLRDGLIIAQNTGIFENTPDDKGGADIDNVKYVEKANKAKADAYIRRLEDYLCDVDIDEYDNAQDNDYDIDPRNVRTLSGWYLKPSYSSDSKIVLRGGSSSSIINNEMKSKTFIATSGQTDFVFASASEAFSPVLVFEEKGLVLGWTYNPLNLTITLPNAVLVAGTTITVTG